MMKRAAVWSVVIFVMGNVSGCFLAWLGAARADDTSEVVCSADGLAEHDVGSEEPSELARVSALEVYPAPQKSFVGPPRTGRTLDTSFAASKVLATCSPGARVAFVTR